MAPLAGLRLPVRRYCTAGPVVQALAIGAGVPVKNVRDTLPCRAPAPGTAPRGPPVGPPPGHG
ncbi:hypothetical protein [Krasilnikovia sp. MM14-A1259]|uniref:hypothetical protein n=1 Tax=Krasilnikovia sp. MM14-A1259 TaxID=3373539 RepID=UPI00399C84A6